MPAQCEPCPENTHTAPSAAPGSTEPVTTPGASAPSATASSPATTSSSDSATTAVLTGSCERLNQRLAATRSNG